MMHINAITRDLSQSQLPTTLFLGAGASIASGAPSGTQLSNLLRDEFFPNDSARLLSDMAGRVEVLFGRQKLVQFIRSKFTNLFPSTTMLQLPNFNFSSIFTTNYDQLIEKSFSNLGVEIPVFRSNKDWNFDQRLYNTILYKLHGCIEEDRVDGLNYGMIITDEDYDTYGNFRQIGFKHFENSLATSNLVFIGCSMSDSNIKYYIDEAVKLGTTQECHGKIYAIQFERDDISALRLENKGINVAFGDLDEFLASLATTKATNNPVGIFSPVSITPKHSIAAAISSIKPSDEKVKSPNLKKLISGGEATYADIGAGLTFPREEANRIVLVITNSSAKGGAIHVLLGDSGCGRTSAARIVLHELSNRGFACYEHKPNLPVDLATWKDIDQEHLENGENAILFLDEPNASQFAVNQLATFLNDGSDHALSLIITYRTSIWSYRTKSPALVKNAIVHDLRKLSPSDVTYIANHLKNHPEIASLLSHRIQGLGHIEIENMIRSRASNDLFVSLKYLFELESLDQIVIKEFDSIAKSCPIDIKADVANIYKTVAFFEAAGRHVHRQMILRICDLDFGKIKEILDYLEGTVFEYERDDRVEGVYIWRTRHARIASIIATSKFSEQQRLLMCKSIISSINPASKVERQFCAAICSSDLGIESFSRLDQTELYAMLCAAVPGERVPRHRYIRNLIKERRFGEAEIALSEARELGITDSVIFRYEVDLHVAKAEHLSFLEKQDRLNLLETAVGKAKRSVSRRPDDMHNYDSLCKATFALAVNGGDTQQFYDAVDLLKEAFDKIGDDLMINWIGKYESERVRLSSHE